MMVVLVKLAMKMIMVVEMVVVLVQVKGCLMMYGGDDVQQDARGGVDGDGHDDNVGDGG